VSVNVGLKVIERGERTRRWKEVMDYADRFVQEGKN